MGTHQRPARHANYYVLALGDSKDYGYALIGEPWRRYLWILSRNKTMDEVTYHKLADIARHHGYFLRLNPLIRVSQQNCPDVVNHQDNLDSKKKKTSQKIVPI